MKVVAIVAAAGQSRRMGGGRNKVFLPLGGDSVLAYSLQALSACPEIDGLVIVTAVDEVSMIEQMVSRRADIKPWRVVAGGSERQYSIANALVVVSTTAEVILVHDGARPLIEPALISSLVAEARRHWAAGIAVPVKDTIKLVDEQGFAIDTPARERLWAMQTPQAFEAGLLRRAYAQAAAEDFLGTDDASLVERLGVKVKLVPGSYRNIKITTPEDLLMAAAFMDKGGRSVVDMRVGIGYDVHRFAAGRKLILGGVEIPYAYGLEGHSDADVVLHAIKDALLGAAACGDIGRHFPDSSPEYKGVSSLLLLEKVRDIVAGQGYAVNNLDATIVAQQPKLAPYIAAMKQQISATLAVPAERINVKATTTEGLGFAGRQEGIAAYAVASVVRQ